MGWSRGPDLAAKLQIGIVVFVRRAFYGYLAPWRIPENQFLEPSALDPTVHMLGNMHNIAVIKKSVAS